MGWVFAYGLANAAYPVVTKLVIKSNSLTAWGRTYYNNLMTFVVLVDVLLHLRIFSKGSSLESEFELLTRCRLLWFLAMAPRLQK